MTMFQILVNLWPVHLLVLAWFTGRMLERHHYQSIQDREMESAERPATSMRSLPLERCAGTTDLAVGSVVISVDHFKRFLGSWRKIFGGELRAHVSVIDRGRREAILRMKESHPDADMFINLRLYTSSIVNRRQNASSAVEVVAVATAIRFERS